MDFRKFKEYRIDLEQIMAFSVHKSGSREKGYHDKIYFYPKAKGKEYFEVSYIITKEDPSNKPWEEAVAMLDDYFVVKTIAESRILP